MNLVRSKYKSITYFISFLLIMGLDVQGDLQMSFFNHVEDEGLITSEPWKDVDVIFSNDSCTPVKNDKYKSCACMVTRTKGVVNLNGIINQNCTLAPGGCKVPRFIVSGDDKWDYAYHPCFPFDMFKNDSHKLVGDHSCIDVAAARYTEESAHICDSLGSQSSFEFSIQKKSKYIASNLGLKFTNTKKSSSAYISLVCNASIPANKSSIRFIGIDNYPLPTYYLALESICCCPSGCNVTFPVLPPDDNKPSKGFWAITGIIIGIIVILVVVAVVLKCVKGRERSPEQQRLIEPVA